MTESATPEAKKRRRARYHGALLAAFARGDSVEEACRAAGVSRSSAWRWRQANGAELERARSEVVEVALGRLRAALSDAADRLATIAKASPDESVAVRACVAIHESFGRLNERSALTARVEALEALLERQGAAGPTPTAPRLAATN